jgi:aspartate/methionine/tyrosine aminotransferase
MKIQPFKLERYFAKYEFSSPFLLSCSDCEPLSLKEVLALADEDMLRLWNDLKLGYTESQGHRLLREEIVELYQTIKPEQVLVITPEEGILIVMNSLLEKGDRVITTFPGYQSLYEIANSLGCEVSSWIPKEDHGWTFDINDFKKLVRDDIRLIVINFPHNPTGATIQERELREIVDIAGQNNILVFSDEMYRFLEYDRADRTSSACDVYDNAVSLFGMSKSFALAGLRIGWLTTKNSELIKKFSIYKDYTTICSGAPSEVLATIALRARNKILKRNLDIIGGNLKVLDEFFADYAGLFDWYRPNAGSIGFPKLKANVDIADFCLDLVERKGVMLLPSAVYDLRSNNFRVGFGRKNMPEALAKLEEYLKEYYAKSTNSFLIKGKRS